MILGILIGLISGLLIDRFILDKPETIIRGKIKNKGKSAPNFDINPETLLPEKKKFRLFKKKKAGKS